MKLKVALLTAAALAVAAASPANGSGFGTYFATVTLAGTVVHSSGVKSARHIGKGQYEITFNREISGCALTANVNGTVPGYAVTKRKARTISVMQVFTYSGVGAPHNMTFSALVLCNS